ncbi:helix-turn-helix transcriptional regulator [Candidatus Regiella endosymbiont of Tuberolachnus salignus]|uniref:helix-turn-helix transcriptional regulator n=1 Tax=Candidatus Regiella endosymbiont of Tuberolachnus salignus TaxID=3077956 RepID=UPI0030D35064
MKKMAVSLKSFSLISIMEHSEDIWGIKDCESRFIYTNRAFRKFLNIPDKFKIEGKSDDQLPTPVAEFAEELKKQDQETISSGQRVTIIKTHFFGREKKLQPYLYEKFPLYDENNECVGTVFYGKKMDFVSPQQYASRITPSGLKVAPPMKLFNKFIFFILQSMSAKEIARKLSRSHRTIENNLCRMYQKSAVSSLKEFRKFCQKTGFDRYIPPEFIPLGIQFIENREASL